MIKEARQNAFLAAYTETGHVKKACEAAGVGKSTHYDWMRQDPEYAERFAEAQKAATADLQDEARRRAVDGLRVYKFTKDGDPIRHPDTCECHHDRREWHLDGGKGRCIAPGCECQAFIGEPYYEHSYSDRLLEVKLKALVDEYRPRQEIVLSGDMQRLIDRMDAWPDEYIARAAANEPLPLIVSSMRQEVVRRLLAGPVEDAEVIEDQGDDTGEEINDE